MSSVKNRLNTSDSQRGTATVGPTGCTNGVISIRDRAVLQRPGASEVFVCVMVNWEWRRGQEE